MKHALKLLASVVLALGISIPGGRAQTTASPLASRMPADGATNVSPDTHLTLTFNAQVGAGTSGEIRIRDASDGSIVDRLDLSIPAGPTRRPAGTGAAPQDAATYQRAVIGGFAEGFHFYPVLAHDRTATIVLHPGVLKYGRTYDVEIDPGAIAIAGFPGFAGPNRWRFRTRSHPPAASSNRIVVAADGSGDFNTVQGAVDSVPDSHAGRVTIFIRAGRYEEIVYFRGKRDGP